MGEKRYNMTDVYEKTGLSRTTISNLYHDRMERIDYETLNKLCKLFKCGVEGILEFKDEDFIR